MNKAFRKNIFRTIKESLGRYLAIMAIIALGVGFFAGLKVTKPGMVETGNDYMRKYSMYDIRLISPTGFTEDDIDKLSENENVMVAAGANYRDFIYVNEDDKEIVLHALSITEGVNDLQLVSGRMPESDDECVLDQYQFGNSDMIGKEITVSDSNDAETKMVFKHKTYTVVGMVNSPMYINIERGTTSIGNGRVSAFVYIMQEGFNYPIYQEAYLKCQDSYDIYTDEYDDFIEDIKPDIEDALDDMGKSGTYILDRSTNTGYMCYDNDTNIVDGVARVFPIFFFLIAALVCSTTMTRMVDDERGQIGTYRALGYSNFSIISKYMIYSGSAALVGCLAGFFGGCYLFPYVISEAYKMLYDFGDGIEFYFSPVLLIICIIVSLICSMGTTFLACKNELRCMPAELIRPKAPAAGKRILLEKLPFVWKRMKFLHKVTARNVFRFKKRMFMMILGIAGCTALVLTGLGVRDSVSNLAEFQYGDIDIHDIETTLQGGNADTAETLLDDMGDDVTGYTELYKSSVELHMDSSIKTVYMIAAEKEDLDGYVSFSLKSGEKAYPEYGEVMLSEKIADIAGVEVGDTITLTDTDSGDVTLTVSGIFKNYVWHYAYVTPETYRDYFDKDCDANTLYINVKNDQTAYEVGAKLQQLDNVMNVSIIPEIKDRVSNMMTMMNAVVWLVIGSAGALAFIVLFNLSNINITERVREIATIKVLGFYSGETGAYVFRENLVLTIIGVVVGLPFGVWLHSFVMSQIQVDMVAFASEIMKISYLYCVVIVLIFFLIVDLVMRRKIEAIDMAESLKSIE